jgi:BirA family biotin operon repressor/biotin-[acetyl-CoA-carboxylase] ligase
MDETSGERLYAAVNDDVRARTDVIEFFPEIDSTNSYLLKQAAPGNGRCRIALADHQTAGRGQRGNTWESPQDAGLYLSCAYTFPARPKQFSCLTLAIGVEVAEALTDLGATCKLKWPNDLILHNGKLGGILTETYSGTEDATTIVVGIGINLELGERRDYMSSSVGRVSDLRQAIPELPEREDIAKPVIEYTVAALTNFAANGFSGFHERWSEFDWLANKAVQVATSNGTMEGIASGIDEDGAFLLLRNDKVERIFSGTVTLL